MRQLEGQLALALFEPEPPRFLCDTCCRLIWHANGDGYCCCTAPGMERISARHRKKMDAECRFYERKAT